MKKALFPVLEIGGGLLVGFVNGFFGGGGGMLCVPLLEKVLHEPTKVAHASAIAVILPISVVSAVVYSAGGYFAAVPFFGVAGGVLAGGLCGALLLKKLPSFWVGLVFALLMIGAGCKLIFL